MFAYVFKNHLCFQKSHTFGPLKKNVSPTYDKIGPLKKNVSPMYDKNVHLCFQMALTGSPTYSTTTYVFYTNEGNFQCGGLASRCIYKQQFSCSKYIVAAGIIYFFAFLIRVSGMDKSEGLPLKLPVLIPCGRFSQYRTSTQKHLVCTIITGLLYHVTIEISPPSHDIETFML